MKPFKIICLLICCFGPLAASAQFAPVKNKKTANISTRIDLKGKTLAVPKRISIREFDRLRPAQIAQLPAASADREALLRLKFNDSWEIGPRRLRDKDMQVVEYFGTYEQNARYISIYPENKYYPRLNNGAPGFMPEMRYLVIRFNPEMGKRYRATIKLKPGQYRNKKVMTNVTGSHNDVWMINYQFNEILFDFIAASREIKISPIIAGTESYYVKYEPLEIEQIKIDRIAE
ncbi:MULTISPECIES: hypothetical protein [unclassified Robiginitalea]|uniref:hypothetical protein n=1 Tax=Robiginitalea TaxID=252306 RepID=UPI00234A93AC|nr:MULTISPECIES: hypothetical protein [unclassified Robiginitalea]MDC6353601.1 hypothetical protein [Robiginitalea sp. PM2]MDC6373234.1 hypothetical protein [Robiginitalea sp. SP8]